MAIPEEKLGLVLAYCRIDALEEGERPLLDGLYDAAEGYLERAGIARPPEGSRRGAQYDLAVNYLILDAYDRREPAAAGSLAENPAFRRLINQLKLTEPAGD